MTDEEYDKKLKFVYEKGAAENGIIWHDLRKKPDDLPKLNHFVLLFNENTGYEIARKPPEKEHCLDVWVTKDNRSIFAKNAVAWAEIPIFNEEEFENAK